MKKIFALFLINLFAISAFGACSLDLDKPCTAKSIDILNTSILDKTSQKTDIQNNKINKDYIEVKMDDYDCQFGVCLPKRTEEIEVPEK